MQRNVGKNNPHTIYYGRSAIGTNSIRKRSCNNNGQGIKTPHADIRCCKKSKPNPWVDQEEQQRGIKQYHFFIWHWWDLILSMQMCRCFTNKSRVERRATKMIPSLSKLLYENWIRSLNMQSLHHRGKQGDICSNDKWYRVENEKLFQIRHCTTRGHPKITVSEGKILHLFLDHCLVRAY